MTIVPLLLVALPGFPDTRWCTANGCEWLLTFMGLFMLVLLALLALAVFLHIRNYFDNGSGSFWRKVM